MENNKYYVPEKEEFCIGFIFEELDFDEVESEVFIKKTIEHPDEIYYVISGITVRVKHLDQEDIESLGWEFVKKHPGTECYDFEISDIKLDVDFDAKNKMHVRIYLSSEDYENELNLFSGTIKNKSELEKLMSQLNIK